MSTTSALAAVRLGRNNLFDLVRLYAAVQVLLVHGREHLGFSWPAWLDPWLALPGVPLFFSISGFLVGLSWLRLEHHWRVFVWHRALRIFPALWFCLFCSVLLLIAVGEGPFLLSVQGGVWLLAQLTVVQVFNPAALRDVGVGVINGSLWTIPVELQFYAVLPLLLLLAQAWRRRLPLWVLPSVIGVLSYGCWRALPTLALQAPFLAKLSQLTLLPHLFQFLLGLLALPLLVQLGRRRTIAVLLASSALALWLPPLQPLLWAALPIGIGLIPAPPLHHPDLSYGLYLFHMPLANALLCVGKSGAAALPLYLVGVVLLACLSWYAVERPALRFKPRAVLQEVR